MPYKVLVTGGTGSVGRAIVQAFTERGDEVTFQYRSNQSEADSLGKETHARPLHIDFLDPFELPDGPFDILVNNAGINVSACLTHDVSDQAWNSTLHLNVTVPFLIARRYLPHMIRQEWGRIVNISSIYGLRAIEQRLPYAVSKHALSGLTKTIAKEYGQHGITCNEICPDPSRVL